MNTSFNTGNRLHPIPTRLIIAGLVPLILLGLVLPSCDRKARSLPVATTKPSASATLLPVQTNPVTSDIAVPLPTRTNVISGITVTPVSSTVTVPLRPTPKASEVEEQLLRRTQYALSAQLNYEWHHLTVSQTVTYVNQTRESLSELLFVVEPNRQPGVLDLNDMSWANGQTIDGYTFEGARLHVPLPDPLASGMSISLSLSYELNLPAQSGPFGYTSRQTNLGDWYPFVPPYRAGQGWLVHEPAVIGEHLVYDVADYWVDLSLASPRTDLTIAASAPAEIDGDWYRYRLDAARSFAWSASSEYQILSATVGFVNIVSYVFPEHLTAGEAALRTTADAVALYAGLFGPYPHTSLVAVEAEFPDGREYDGLYFLGQEYYATYAGNPQGYLTTIVAHETSHQWWYGLVGNDQATEPWLDEALAIYSELLFYEIIYPDLIDWWWEFRVTRFNPAGQVSSTIYDHDGFRPYVNAVYLRGARFMDELRNLIGDEAFYAFLRDYARQSTYSQVTAEDFFTILAEHSSADLSMLKSVYFVSTATVTETPAPTVESTATPVGGCRRPIEDYTRVTINGEVVNRRTALMLDTAMEVYGGPGDLRRVTQGSYTDALTASFGSHEVGGVVDISVRNPANSSEYLFAEVEAMVRALRQAGFAAWYLEPGEIYEGAAPHIHAVAIGDKELSPAAQEQLTGPHGYFRGMDGLPRNPPHPDRHGGPIICPWMLDARYADLREENAGELP